MGSHTINIVRFSEEDMIHNLNVGKDAIVGQLVSDGVITSEQATPYIQDYHITIKTPSWVSRWWGHICKNNDAYRIILLKQVNMKVPENLPDTDERKEG